MEEFKRMGANQNIDPEYAKMISGVSENLIGRAEGISMEDFIYKPKNNELKPCESAIGVKFSNDVFIHPSQLDKWGVKYEESDLEDNPLFGKAFRIKRNDNFNAKDGE